MGVPLNQAIRVGAYVVKQQPVTIHVLNNDHGAIVASDTSVMWTNTRTDFPPPSSRSFCPVIDATFWVATTLPVLLLGLMAMGVAP